MGIDSDLLLGVGVILTLLVLPRIAKSFVDETRPYVAWLLLVLGIVSFAFGVWLSPGGFSFSDVPLALVEVLARLFN